MLPVDSIVDPVTEEARRGFDGEDDDADGGEEHQRSTPADRKVVVEPEPGHG